MVFKCPHSFNTSFYLWCPNFPSPLYMYKSTLKASDPSTARERAALPSYRVAPQKNSMNLLRLEGKV